MKASDYECIEAWGKMCGSNYAYVLDEQEKAAKRDAPVDAIYRMSNGSWATLTGVLNNQTLAYFENHHPHLYERYVRNRTQPQTINGPEAA